MEVKEKHLVSHWYMKKVKNLIKNLEQSVRDDIAFLKASPLIPQSIDIHGFIYDVRTGQLQAVDA